MKNGILKEFVLGVYEIPTFLLYHCFLLEDIEDNNIQPTVRLPEKVPGFGADHFQSDAEHSNHSHSSEATKEVNFSVYNIEIFIFDIILKFYEMKKIYFIQKF